jgi:homocysteine S-methyltransferase
MKKPFLEAVEAGPLVFDGGVGTQLYERGVYTNRSFDDANLSRADLVRQIHEDYLHAGAQILTTNTFAANRVKLRRHSLEDKLEAINRAGVQIAKEIAGDGAYVAGSIGPTGQTPTMLTDGELDEIRQVFSEQAKILADEGVDLIVLETFRQLSEIRLAIDAVRQECDLPIIAQMAFDADFKTGDGAGPERVVMLLKDWGADVVGANCMEGPHVLFDVVTKMVGKDIPIIAQPNAGYPRYVAERLVYMATPDYFGTFARRYFKAGVAIVGGCCGTNPEHIKKIAGAARMMSGGASEIRVIEPRPELSQQEHHQPVPVAERSRLATKIDRVWRERVKAPVDKRPALHRDNFVVSVEVNPPKGLDPSKSVKAAKMLAEGGVDVVNIADGPRASVRMSNWALGRLIHEELDMETILHVCARDRNLLGLQADMLAYHTLELNNLVVITGDPPKVGDYPHATAVFDLDSVGMLRMIEHFNRGTDPAGKDVGQVTSFYCACGAEPAALDYERELRRLEEKKAAGASMIMTQPVYDPDVLDRFLRDTEHLEMPVLVGLLPLASWRNAEFLHNEVPGMAVPEDIRARMKEAGSGPTARAEGVKIAQETLMEIKDRVVGAYIMPPFGRYVAALEILSCIDGYTLPE